MALFGDLELTAAPVWIAVAVWLLVIVVHIGFAFAVYRDADGLAGTGRGLELAGPALWFMGTLVGGVFAAGVYWLVNHSTLRPPAAPRPETPRYPDQSPT